MSETRKTAFERALPNGFFVQLGDEASLEAYLRRQEVLAEEETLSTIQRAGEGNMNLTLRVTTSSRSFIVKQARPWVEKYPEIDAPARRAEVEIAFYQTARSSEKLRRSMPELLGSDPSSGVLVLEDLGEAQDFTWLYRGQALASEPLEELVDFLVTLHSLPDAAIAPNRAFFENREMRALNHEHMFRFPLAADNGLDLDAITPGLASAAEELKNDPSYSESVTNLGAQYLSDGETLLHGDYFPGSWLGTEDGVRIIDAEFCLLGTPAIELGVMLGHLHLADQPEEIRDALVSLYCERAKILDDELVRLTRRFAGAEIMRRLIGVAQLPLSYGLERKVDLLKLSRQLVLRP
jgi:5-methylthioribose kinase